MLGFSARKLFNPVNGVNRISRTIFFLVELLIVADSLNAQQETIYMAVLSSRKHHIGALDNPTVGLFISTDAGATWQHRGWRGYIRTFYTETGSDGTIWSACGNGVLQSSDNGATWRITSGWNMTEALKVKVDPANPSIAYAATAYGIFKTTDKGEHWQEKNSGFQKPFTADVVIDQSNTSRLFAATENGLYRSSNSGNHWSLAGLKGKGIRTILQDPNNNATFFAGTENDGVYISRDGGKFWKQHNNGLNHFTVYTIVVDHTDPQTIYVGTHGGGVYRSRDSGLTWMQKSDGLQNLDTHSLCVLPSNPRIIFAGTLNGGLFKSTDGGETWEFNSQDEGQVWGLFVR